ncbi:flagellar export chaperone FliS [Pseudomonas sp. WS 5059]|jgi:flagellar protein FliS|uniref:flagellar export chaperone FliS n=1 Tax=unclassified Pseudomonas TaxID=196821 RepID=UPI0014734AE0|nr:MULTISPECIES: flagellar export chaperone FliS [unclassified Pseudomonas]NMX70250.1 flagellar export chaperone FliS [Pseudomonas sp. WS 5111]NMX87384.1 flagellar export chaperone FliS [Pseudomonas sp. WS 5010]NMY04380.1 flagellar export chaperone FliS [Pseudomonas sp. WS 5059]NMY25221.1 flagellar export chaperone FliS [Pseudomonas sp. WS 5021]
MNPMKALRQYQKVNSHAQVSEASPHRLIQMLLEGGLDRMAQAKGAMARGDVAQKCVLIAKAIDIITGLRQGLDEEKADDPAAIQQLDSLYEYMNTRLVQANSSNDPEIIDEVARLMITVKQGWDAIAPQ